MSQDEILKLAKELALSHQVRNPTSRPIVDSMIDVSERVAVVDAKRRAGLETLEFSEALMSVVETAEALDRMQGAMTAVAETGQMNALIDAVKSASEDRPDVDAIAKSLRMVAEPTR